MDERLRKLQRDYEADPSFMNLARLTINRLRSGEVSPPGEIPDRISDWNWGEAFKYADGFTAEDVALVIAAEDGENDADSWVACMALNDGRYAYIEAGCDYTGWGWQEWGQSAVADSLNEIIRLGMPEWSRKALGLPDPPPPLVDLAGAAND